MKGSKLTLVPAGPCCPSEPFADSREKEREVTENHQSCIVNQQGNGSVCIQMHVEWLILCSQKHLQIAKMRQTHSYAWSSRSPCFPFLTFAARLPWVSSITLTVTQVAIVMQIFLFKQIIICHPQLGLFLSDMVVLCVTIISKLNCQTFRGLYSKAQTFSPLPPLNWPWMSAC